MAQATIGISRLTPLRHWSHGGAGVGSRRPPNRIPFPPITYASLTATTDRSSVLSLSLQSHLCSAVASSGSTASILSSVEANRPDFELDTTGGAGDGFGDRNDGGGGGGGGGGDGGSGGGGGDRSEEGSSGDEKKLGLSMSQKLTLIYAAIVGAGGFMGFLKSGSQKSLLAGGISALLLSFVFTQLPVRPVFASSLGLGISAALLAVMGSRFRRSGKIFPAGVVSLVSFVMTGGYFHGILRSVH